MEGDIAQVWACEMIEKLGIDAGESLDEPVVEYLARLLMDVASDESEPTDLHEALSNFLPGLTDVEGAVIRLVQAFSQDQRESKDTKSTNELSVVSLQFVRPGDNSNRFAPSTNGICTAEPTINSQTEDIASAVANVKLSACAREFVPPSFIQDQDNSSGASSFHEQYSFSDGEGSDTSQTGTGNSFQEFWEAETGDSVDAIGLLSCLYPMYSIDALQMLLLANNGNLAFILRILGQMESDMHSSTESHANVAPEKIVDMSESTFPSLPSTGSAASKIADVRNDPGRNFVTAVKKQVPKIVNEHREYSNLQETNAFFQRAPKKSIPWVETGDFVSKQYTEARKEAREFARRRNAYFEQATKAYLAGNKALAKDLGAKGRWCCDKMKECHAVAAEGIFQDRNKRFRNTKLGVPQVLDLHGLHMSEASRILHRELECLSKLGKLQSVSVLVGTGHHTKGSRTPSRLPGAVRRFLDKEGYIHKPGQPGVLEVKL